ncbi:3' terminal RNA ribose 2'-O-methyltransferase Hen1 [Actinocorallia lasiicapitis]
MLLTITTTMTPATELGFLLHKHPDRVQAFEQTSGTAHVFYPEATAERCTAALLLEVDPITLTRTRARNSPDFSLGQYVNDRPYAASSLLSSALNAVFRTAMRGRCDSRQELADGPIPLELTLPALPCRGGPDFARRLFEPLGWRVEAVPVPLDERFPEWGDSRYVTLTLRGDVRLADALNQIYVLLPVLDDAKHYWVSPDEVDKLIRSGEGWLAEHPLRDQITRRYLGNRRTLVQSALRRLAEVDDAPEDALETPVGTAEEHERKVPLNERRAEAVLAALHQEGARTVLDLGCGPGALLALLVADRSFTKVTGVDVAFGAVRTAHRRLKTDRLPPAQAERISVFQGALTYVDDRFAGYDAAVLMEVIEHLDASRLPALAEVVFGHAKPGTVIVTTPNVEHNVRYEGLTGLRHPDHRFEWTRAEFAAWAGEIATAYGYTVRHVPVGDDDPEVGPPTQMGVFTR